MIRVRDLRKVYKTRFGEKLVLDGISFDLAMGERLGILGRNGAGKSTLVRLISGAEMPTAGVIEREMSVSWPLAFSGAFQPQLTGLDNVRFISRIYEQDFERNIAFVEEFAELGSYLREPVVTYSSGMRARLAFAISMIIEFDCFLIDEVGAVGDARFHERCNKELFDKRGDRAMIIISHDASYIRDHCNRFAVLHDARLTQFDEFDAAFAFYGEQVGLGAASAEIEAPETFARRTVALDSLRRLAFADERFRVLVQKGDWARDQGDWDEALARYGAALTLHSYERSYWVQYGHVARESGRNALAECAYRTACACGEPTGPLKAFLELVEKAQDPVAPHQPFRSPDHGPLCGQPPAFPDLALLAALILGGDHVASDDAARLLRDCTSLDALAAHLLGEPGAHAGLRRPLSSLPDAVALVPHPPEPAERWFTLLSRLIGLGDTSADPQHREVTIGEALAGHRVFADWPSAGEALSRLIADTGQRPSIDVRTIEKNHA